MALLPTDPKQQKKLLAAILPLLLAAAYWFFYYQDERGELDRLAAANQALETQNHNARIHARSSADQEERLAQLIQYVQRLEKLIPRVEEVAGLLHAVNEEAQRAGVAIERFNPITSEDAQFYTREVYDIGVIGMYHDIGRFLAAIGSLDRIVTSINFRTVAQHGTDRDGNVRLEARFGIQTYVLPAAEEGGVDEPD